MQKGFPIRFGIPLILIRKPSIFRAKTRGNKLPGRSLMYMGRAIDFLCLYFRSANGGGRLTLWPRVKPFRKRLPIVFCPAEFWIHRALSGYPQSVYPSPSSTSTKPSSLGFNNARQAVAVSIPGASDSSQTEIRVRKP